MVRFVRHWVDAAKGVHSVSRLLAPVRELRALVSCALYFCELRALVSGGVAGAGV